MIGIEENVAVKNERRGDGCDSKEDGPLQRLDHLNELAKSCDHL